MPEFGERRIIVVIQGESRRWSFIGDFLGGFLAVPGHDRPLIYIAVRYKSRCASRTGELPKRQATPTPGTVTHRPAPPMPRRGISCLALAISPPIAVFSCSSRWRLLSAPAAR